ncbi:ribosomal protein S18 acetylase RimI-like enzyme [Pontibacter ummariensis]|uniref:Ribosomal protein S18 acetylase RimI n=1 Tax=Pontibacter ummariensis TaxID=1610492 RepID=A0A239J077_9BACT|nr:GNAT family N-acetyltransferase [Pontibacter ummariensis]PRY09001.1 ribosomal protein S18 acetylase RimI-like enzyme [Pontibacter ummariensis]SNS98064.1 Ribosomal protein S18 acetylase RimI [Pontibacter ummariensis]
MAELSLQIEPLTDSQQTPFDLLELADPSKAHINAYLESGACYIAKVNSELIGVMVLKEVDSSTIEIKNIAIKETDQGKGIGKALLKHAATISRESGYKNLRIGTGNSSIGQLALYQKEGFEIKSVEKDFFLKHYDELIFENGIQCKHMIVLEKDLKTLT